MPTFRLTAKAIADLKSIGRYTEDTWGREQRDKYLIQLNDSFRMLAQEPHKGRSCDDIREGYRKYHVGRHLIFYRQTVKDIEIIRILHDRMDMENHLSEA
jgi:toxin ParE1/3/4